MSPYLAGGIFAFFVASCLGTGYLGYNYAAEKCSAEDKAHDLAESQNTVIATKHVVSEVETQGNISREASKDYAKNINDIGTVYSSGVQSTPAAAGNGLPAVRQAPGGTCPFDSGKTKVYKLTPQQCDQEEAKCNALWNWANRQSAVK